PAPASSAATFSCSSPTAERTSTGAVVQRRSSRQTSMPLPSGSTRSRIIASGGRGAALVRAGAAVSATPPSSPAPWGGRPPPSRPRPPRSRRPGGSCAPPAGSEARRRRRGSARSRSYHGALGDRELEHEDRAAGRRDRLDPQPAAVRFGEAAGDREAEPGPGRAPSAPLEGLEDPLAIRLEHARPVTPHPDRDARRVPCRRDLDGIGRRRELKRVLEHVDEHTLDLRRIGADDLRLAGDDDRDPAPPPPHPLERPLHEQGHPPHPG